MDNADEKKSSLLTSALTQARGFGRRSPVLVGLCAISCMIVALLALGNSRTPAPPAFAGTPGLARLCLSADFDLGGGKAELPSTTVLDGAGALQGRREDPASWTATPGIDRSAIVTLAPVTLARSAPCADIPVKMLVTAGADSTSQTAAETHLFTIANVLDYPVPVQKPAVEFGKLVDDVGVKAILLSDVGGAMKQEAAYETETARAAACLSTAQGLAAEVTGGVSRQSEQAVFLKIGGVGEASLTCPVGSKSSPDLFVSWNGQVRPPLATMAFIARGGAYLTGAAPAELQTETAACISQAQAREADGAADRQFRGVKLECTVDGRPDGGGTVTLYRRFGRAPARAETTSADRQAMEQASAEAKADDERKAAAELKFAQDWQDASIPQDVKTFAMITARKVALAERCPTWVPSAGAMEEQAAAAGVEPTDLQPGGRYAALMAAMLRSMRAGTAQESVEAACESARQYH